MYLNTNLKCLRLYTESPPLKSKAFLQINSILFFFCGSILFGGDLSLPFKVCAFQTVLNPAVYSDYNSYTSSLAELIHDNPGQDLYIFPEYTTAAAFLSWLESPEDITPEGLAGHLGDWNRQIYSFWLDLALETGSYILAGTTLVEKKGKIYNRALIFSPDSLFYSQDKVFLGDPEKDLGLSPGEYAGVELFTIKGVKIGLTICRDTYNSVWSDVFRDIDLWIDIKGNELPYTEEYFDQALPARLREHEGCPLGLTLCVTGPLLNFRFNGFSSLIRKDEILKITDTPDGYGVIRFSVKSGELLKSSEPKSYTFPKEL